MRDDLDKVVADQFRLLDQVSVPDTWSKVRSKVLAERPAEVADFVEQDLSFAQRQAPSSTSKGSPRRDWMLTAAAVLLVVVAAVAIVQRSHTPGVVTTATPDPTTAAVQSSLASAIESAGVLIEPSAEEFALASDTRFFQLQSSSTQVTTDGTFASLLKCGRPVEQNTGRAAEEPAEATCGGGWGYVTGSVDGGRVHRGVLGEANAPEMFVLDDRFFVAMESSPSSQPAPTAWLIDSVSGGYAELTWRDEATTVNSPEQAVLVSGGLQTVAENARRSALDGEQLAEFVREGSSRSGLFLPRVVDARDGTIRPLVVPDNALARLPVTHTERGRIWIGTTPDGHDLGVAYTDDGGTTWTEVRLPAELFAESEKLEGVASHADELEKAASYGDQLLSIAADADRIAVTEAWSYDERDVYISGDAGLSWSTVPLTVTNPYTNGAHLYVVGEKRLLLVRSMDPYASDLLVSTGSDWTDLERDSRATQAATSKTSEYVAVWNEGRYVSANREGIVSMFFPVETFDDGSIGGMADAPPNRYRFSTDMRNWLAVPILED